MIRCLMFSNGTDYKGILKDICEAYSDEKVKCVNAEDFTTEEAINLIAEYEIKTLFIEKSLNLDFNRIESCKVILFMFGGSV